jgi:hypothetical protein
LPLSINLPQECATTLIPRDFAAEPVKTPAPDAPVPISTFLFFRKSMPRLNGAGSFDFLSSLIIISFLLFRVT